MNIHVQDRGEINVALWRESKKGRDQMGDADIDERIAKRTLTRQQDTSPSNCLIRSSSLIAKFYALSRRPVNLVLKTYVANFP